jgi:hypothetical protein
MSGERLPRRREDEMTAFRWLAMALPGVALAVAGACEKEDVGKAAGTDADADGDTDADADGDADSDSDGDGDTTFCSPGEIWCDGNWVAECSANGTQWIQIENCADQGLVCAAGECVDISQQCASAINEKSYIGCEYWGATLSNSQLNGAAFGYAIAVANDGAEAAWVNVYDGPGGTVDNDYQVPAGAMTIIDDLPWKLGIKEPGTTSAFATRKVANAAYHITSDLPVTVYQFNPLHYQTGANYSYTNDASLLLPAHVYRSEYVAVSRAPTKIKPLIGAGTVLPGFLAIIGPDDGPVYVDITFLANTQASDSGSNQAYPAMTPGQTAANVVIQPYEVLQILSGAPPNNYCPDQLPCSSNNCCNVGPEYDLTGTRISVVSGPAPAVFSGTDCSFVPYNKYACDHLEQQMFPLETWGTHYLCAHNTTQAPAEPTVWRIVSGSNNNQIQFNPAVHPAVTLHKGQYVEFESLGDFEITGEGRVAVAQFMVGQNYTSDLNPPQNGDPAMSLGVPVEQYRTSYTFLAPTSYVYNYLTAIHLIGAPPSLDGAAISGTTVEITDEWARTNLEISGGIHSIHGEEPFAITVYGVGSYTSYMYPGGLDLKEVPIVVE